MASRISPISSCWRSASSSQRSPARTGWSTPIPSRWSPPAPCTSSAAWPPTDSATNVRNGGSSFPLPCRQADIRSRDADLRGHHHHRSNSASSERMAADHRVHHHRGAGPARHEANTARTSTPAYTPDRPVPRGRTDIIEGVRMPDPTPHGQWSAAAFPRLAGADAPALQRPRRAPRPPAGQSARGRSAGHGARRHLRPPRNGFPCLSVPRSPSPRPVRPWTGRRPPPAI